MEVWEVLAREGCRDTMARYNHFGDRLLLPAMSETFTEDGALEVRGQPPVVGRAAIVEFMEGVGRSSTPPEPAEASSVSQPRAFVRHHVTSIHFESVAPTEAKVASYFSVFTDVGLDHTGRYRDRFVPVGGMWLIAHRLVTTDSWASGSRFSRSAG